MKKTFYVIILLFFTQTFAFSQSKISPLFKLSSSSKTGIKFNNLITENDTLNILNQANIYNGGGIGVADFNNDGFMDVYFAGNMVSNKLYINKGKSSLSFEDVTQIADVSGEGKWCTGVSIVDINADGLPDIYVCASFLEDENKRANLLYINQGNNAKGIPTFKEDALAYGIADTGYSTQGYFFDYDNDNDLDLYLVTNHISDPQTPIKFRPKLLDGSALNTDRLYRNNGNKTFTNISKQAGILIEGWGHSACISDFNRDGFYDIYVSNDFISNDVLYINNHDGTFTNRVSEYFKHSGWNSMGTDASDLNNDGFVDLISLEMLPESNVRKKRMLSGNEYYNYTNAQNFGYEHQYIRNTLQINSGNTPLGHPIFSERAMMSGIYQTDWSWCPLVADFDNDGLRDIIITNGLPRDVTDLDYISYDNGQIGNNQNFSLALVDSLPIVKIPNYAFKNAGNSLFENKSQDWGFTQSNFSNGGIYADFDNDGDLDVMINNINDEASVYENTSKNGNQLTIKLIGLGQNLEGFGAKININYAKNQQQYYEHQPARGYLSSVDSRVHFGLGNIKIIDSLRIVWNDNATQLLTKIDVSKSLTIFQKDNSNQNIPSNFPKKALFKEISQQLGINYKPVEDDFVDYNVQSTLPHKLSQFGPSIAVADIDNNGFDDFYVGGSSSNLGVFFMQNPDGNFTKDSNRFLQIENPLVEDMGVLFFDANNDGFQDMYMATGSYELPPNHEICQDRFYLNDGKGNFMRMITALPTETSNGSCVRASDFDSDGDLDLFVGGRVVSMAYPTAPESFILRNNNGKFENVTAQICPNLKNLGMITDALWTDFDNDGKQDLLIVGEWMPIIFMKNMDEKLIQVAQNQAISQHTGWWNSITSGDFDNDGDMDYVIGNQGLNSHFKATSTEPMTILAKDLDQNGSLDAMVFCFMKDEDNSMKPFPMHTKDDLANQLLSIRKKFPTYKSFGKATMSDLWNKSDRENAINLQATDMKSSYVENKGNGQFTIKSLPIEAQVAPIFGMKTEDVDGDGNLDILMVGNDFGMEPYGGRHDAFNGLILSGDGKGNFISKFDASDGFFVNGDAKGFACLMSAKDEQLYVITQNQDSLRVFLSHSIKQNNKIINLKPDDIYAEIFYKNGKKRKIEFYYGSTFLSQSSRKFLFGNEIEKLQIFDSNGVKRAWRNQ